MMPNDALIARALARLRVPTADIVSASADKPSEMVQPIPPSMDRTLFQELHAVTLSMTVEQVRNPVNDQETRRLFEVMDEHLRRIRRGEGTQADVDGYRSALAEWHRVLTADPQQTIDLDTEG